MVSHISSNLSSSGAKTFSSPILQTYTIVTEEPQKETNRCIITPVRDCLNIYQLHAHLLIKLNQYNILHRGKKMYAIYLTKKKHSVLSIRKSMWCTSALVDLCMYNLALFKSFRGGFPFDVLNVVCI